MSFVTQNTFNIHQSKGQPGAISRTSQPFLLDNNDYIAGEELKPGYGVLRYDGKYYRPKSGDAAYIIGIVNYVPQSLNRTFTQRTGNNPGEIVINPGDSFQIMLSGHAYVALASTVQRHDAAEFSVDENAWKVATKNEYANPIFFEESGVAGDIVSVRINGLIRTFKDVQRENLLD